MQPATAFTAHRNLSQPALIYHSFSRPISACLDLSQLFITYHNPQRFIAVRVIVYPLLILTYKFAKIKGFSKKFFKTGKDICRRKNIIITIPRYTALQSHIPHSSPLIRRVSACVLIRFCICTIPSPRTITPASLVKGRWIDGKAQTVALLLSACDMPAPFILQTFLPSRRKDCRTEPFHSHNPLKSTAALAPEPTLPKPHYPSKSTIAFLAYERSVGFASLQSWSFVVGASLPRQSFVSLHRATIKCD